MNQVLPLPSPRSRGGFVWHVVPLLAYLALVFYGGSLPGSQLPRVVWSDKVVHLVGFSVMQVLAFRAMRYGWPRRAAGWQLSGSVLFASAAGAGLELLQCFLPHRSAELLDWVADTIGALVSAGILGMLLRSRGSGERGEDGKEQGSRAAGQ